jgi:hypothetical protein
MRMSEIAVEPLDANVDWIIRDSALGSDVEPVLYEVRNSDFAVNDDLCHAIIRLRELRVAYRQNEYASHRGSTSGRRAGISGSRASASFEDRAGRYRCNCSSSR